MEALSVVTEEEVALGAVEGEAVVRRQPDVPGQRLPHHRVDRLVERRAQGVLGPVREKIEGIARLLFLGDTGGEYLAPVERSAVLGLDAREVAVDDEQVLVAVGVDVGEVAVPGPTAVGDPELDRA